MFFCGEQKLFIVIAIALLLSGCVSESNFRLSDDSRLPLWFELPEGKTREDVSVRLYYYAMPSGRQAELVLSESGRLLSTQKVKGDLRGLESLRVGNASRKDYPRYEVLDAKGQTDIIFHKGRSDTFFMVDDPDVWSELGVKRD